MQPLSGLRNFETPSQGSSFLATLGFEAESLWDSPIDRLFIALVTSETDLLIVITAAAMLMMPSRCPVCRGILCSLKPAALEFRPSSVRRQILLRRRWWPG